MKHSKILISLTLAAIALSSFPASAAEEQYEEFARKYMPESQAVYEDFRGSCKAAQVVLSAAAGNPKWDPDFNASVCMLRRRKAMLEERERFWADTVERCFSEYNSGETTSEDLKRLDVIASREAIEWKHLIYEALVEAFEVRGRPITKRIPGRDYEIGVYEVTQRQYQTVMGKNPSISKDPNYPVHNVSWSEAVEFCKKLTERERKKWRLSENLEFRLPTSEEWEFACRAGTTTRFYTGDTEADLARAGWYYGNRGDKVVHPVGQKVPNLFGLYDMHGNVREWCSDCLTYEQFIRIPNVKKSTTKEWFDENYYPNRVGRGAGVVNLTKGIGLYSSGLPFPIHCSVERDTLSGFRVVLALVKKQEK